nr:multiple epidermal growth factor-like domains protein 10 isoform X1 [Crassostrea gigas]
MFPNLYQEKLTLKKSFYGSGMLTINCFLEVWIFLLLILKLCNIVEAVNGNCTSPETKKVCCSNYHEVNGVCMKCPIGTFGENCTENCPDGTYGELCSQRCDCKINQRCNLLFGCLECLNGTNSTNCVARCPDNMYGKSCSLKCQCKRNQKCDRIFGCIEQDLEPQFTFTTLTLLMILAGLLIIISIVIGVTVCVVKRITLSRKYSVYQSPVPLFYSGDKQIQLSEIEQGHYQTLF